MTADWRALLDQAIAEDPRGITGVAERIGYSRPAVSRVLAGCYPNPGKVGAAVLAAYNLVACPHLQRGIKPDDCRAYAAMRYQAIAAAQVEHWRACRKCPLNPLNPDLKEI